MILLINGPFGVGKTTASALVARRLGARIVDVELVGSLVRQLGVGPEIDVQDSSVWRALAVACVASVHRTFRRICSSQ